MAGQSVGMVDKIQATEDIISELIEQANIFLGENQPKVA
jgi:NAD(P)H-dependent flavin oxidoreductase YrpB (nitropropane dioxygenase family)